MSTATQTTTAQTMARWLDTPDGQTLGGLVDAFGQKAYALLFVLLLGLSALPAPTVGVTHVLDVVAVLVAAQLITGRDSVWLPARWRRIRLGGSGQARYVSALLRLVRRVERRSRPRMASAFATPAGRIAFGVSVIVFTTAAFLAPPFTGLDTLPALGVVVISLGVLLEDLLVAVVGVVLGLVGVALELTAGAAFFALLTSWL